DPRSPAALSGGQGARGQRRGRRGHDRGPARRLRQLSGYSRAAELLAGGWSCNGERSSPAGQVMRARCRANAHVAEVGPRAGDPLAGTCSCDGERSSPAGWVMKARSFTTADVEAVVSRLGDRLGGATPTAIEVREEHSNLVAELELDSGRTLIIKQARYP